MSEDLSGASIGQLSHHIGLHVEVNLDGMLVGGELCRGERWVRGKVALGNSESNWLRIQLDEPFGEQPVKKGRFGRQKEAAAETVLIDDAKRVRALALDDVHPDGAQDEVAQLVAAGKRLQAVKRYRELNGATLQEAQAYIAGL